MNWLKGVGIAPITYLALTVGFSFLLVMMSRSRWRRAIAVKTIFDALIIFVALLKGPLPAGVESIRLEVTVLLTLAIALVAASLASKDVGTKSGEA